MDRRAGRGGGARRQLTGTEWRQLPGLWPLWHRGFQLLGLCAQPFGSPLPVPTSPHHSLSLEHWWGGSQGWEAGGPQGGLLTLCGLPISGEEPAAPLHRGPPPLRARLGHSQRPASRPRPSPDYPHRQRSWPRPSGPRQPGHPGTGPPGRGTRQPLS